ncbi:MAG: hydrolase [Planctomycetota bacterium]|nr:hydrolase [Planctomycetota bacterium]
MSHETILCREDAALVVIDMQEKLLPKIAEQERVLANCCLLIEGAKRLEVPILLTEQYPKGLGPTVKAIADLLAAAPRLEKMTFSCGRSDAFLEALESVDREQIVLCGIEAHVCVLQTALDLRDEGWQVHVPYDAIGSRNDANRLAAIERMRAAGIIITTAESVLFELLAVAGTPEFKDVVRLLR